ncbi:MAG TPA: LON peptidase substrate-binding domain-containing protein, partial [Pirellulaceae bacterium]|nr:LON peptidase substrate-binding domain-containing protein [Pirellulaceae bacterium]
MSLQPNDLEIPGFTGIVRLFPLSNLVLFPSVMQPLHIFEPRYRKMMRHALEGDGLIAMALFKHNIDTSAPSYPTQTQAIHDIVTVGKILAHVELEDGRFNLLLKGISRAQIVREIATEQPFRMANVQLLREPSVPQSLERELRGELVNAYLCHAENDSSQ